MYCDETSLPPWIEPAGRLRGRVVGHRQAEGAELRPERRITTPAAHSNDSGFIRFEHAVLLPPWALTQPTGVSAGCPCPQTVAAQRQIEQPRRNLDLESLAYRTLGDLRRADDTGADDGRLLDATSGVRIARRCGPVTGPDIRIASALPVQRHPRPHAEPAIARRRRGRHRLPMATARSAGARQRQLRVRGPRHRTDGVRWARRIRLRCNGIGGCCPRKEHQPKRCDGTRRGAVHDQTLVRSVRISITL